jgi:hypothetical protein
MSDLMPTWVSKNTRAIGFQTGVNTEFAGQLA